jgi:hypothetical protein
MAEVTLYDAEVDMDDIKFDSQEKTELCVDFLGDLSSDDIKNILDDVSYEHETEEDEVVEWFEDLDEEYKRSFLGRLADSKPEVTANDINGAIATEWFSKILSDDGRANFMRENNLTHTLSTLEDLSMDDVVKWFNDILTGHGQGEFLSNIGAIRDREDDLDFFIERYNDLQVQDKALFRERLDLLGDYDLDALYNALTYSQRADFLLEHELTTNAVYDELFSKVREFFAVMSSLRETTREDR